MRLRRRVVKQPHVLWVAVDDNPPHPYLVASLRRAGIAVRELHWAVSKNGQLSFGRYLEFGDRTGHEPPMGYKLVGPRILLELARAPEDLLITYELEVLGLYIGLSKLLHRHMVISLIEGDYPHIGRACSGPFRVLVRWLAARSVDVFVANNPPARDYLIRTLDVPQDKIIVGWWLAGMPADLPARHLAAAAPEAPLFVCAGWLIPLKGTDLLIHAVAVYQRQFGRCRLWVIGEGPERESLVQLSRRLGVDDMVTFLGKVDHQALKAAFQACQAFVFPTLGDFTGRVLVEALSAGAPVLVSPMSGAVGTIVHDGVNGSSWTRGMQRHSPRPCIAPRTRISRAPSLTASTGPAPSSPRSCRRGVAQPGYAGAGWPGRIGT